MLEAPNALGEQPHERIIRKRLNKLYMIAGAQAYATDLTNKYAGNSTAFAAATARFSVVGQCLFNATIAADASASASATAASTAIAQSDATAASDAITGAICNPVTATATAQAFAQAIAQAQGCNGVIYQAISSKNNVYTVVSVAGCIDVGTAISWQRSGSLGARLPAVVHWHTVTVCSVCPSQRLSRSMAVLYTSLHNLFSLL